MDSITGKPGHFVVWRSKDLESGTLINAKGYLCRYCAWRDGGDIKEVEGTSEEGFNDAILLRLAKANPQAARWLARKSLRLDDPFQTVIRLADADAIPFESRYNRLIETIELVRYSNRRKDIWQDLIKGYGWVRSAGWATPPIYIFPDYTPRHRPLPTIM